LYLYIVFFVLAAIFSFLINNLFLKFSNNLGAHNITDETIIRWGSTSKPSLGGISFYIIFLFSISCYSIFVDSNRFLLNTQVIGLLTSVTLAFLMGLADDAYNTKPLLKSTTYLRYHIDSYWNIYQNFPFDRIELLIKPILDCRHDEFDKHAG
jgi:UDP-N-acetylmuramyl pentapeptide phosphotransferase/UDP-N-acetylglucosamine-1-phosphate transferase